MLSDALRYHVLYHEGSGLLRHRVPSEVPCSVSLKPKKLSSMVAFPQGLQSVIYTAAVAMLETWVYGMESLSPADKFAMEVGVRLIRDIGVQLR